MAAADEEGVGKSRPSLWGQGKKRERAEVGEEQLVWCEERLGVGWGAGRGIVWPSTEKLKPGIMVKGQGHETNVCRKKSQSLEK